MRGGAGGGELGVHVEGKSAKARLSTVMDNDTAGMASGGGIRLQGADVMGNGVASGCATNADCGDLASYGRPSLRDSTCGTSRNLSPGRTWGVCVND